MTAILLVGVTSYRGVQFLTFTLACSARTRHTRHTRDTRHILGTLPAHSLCLGGVGGCSETCGSCFSTKAQRSMRRFRCERLSTGRVVGCNGTGHQAEAGASSAGRCVCDGALRDWALPLRSGICTCQEPSACNVQVTPVEFSASSVTVARGPCLRCILTRVGHR